MYLKRQKLDPVAFPVQTKQTFQIAAQNMWEINFREKRKSNLPTYFEIKVEPELISSTDVISSGFLINY